MTGIPRPDISSYAGLARSAAKTRRLPGFHFLTGKPACTIGKARSPANVSAHNPLDDHVLRCKRFPEAEIARLVHMHVHANVRRK
jgi:hypothetical protein